MIAATRSARRSATQRAADPRQEARRAVARGSRIVAKHHRPRAHEASRTRRRPPSPARRRSRASPVARRAASGPCAATLACRSAPRGGCFALRIATAAHALSRVSRSASSLVYGGAPSRRCCGAARRRIRSGRGAGAPFTLPTGVSVMRRDLVVAQALDVAQDEHGPVRGAQPLELLVEPLAAARGVSSCAAGAARFGRPRRAPRRRRPRDERRRAQTASHTLTAVLCAMRSSQERKGASPR